MTQNEKCIYYGPWVILHDPFLGGFFYLCGIILSLLGLWVGRGDYFRHPKFPKTTITLSVLLWPLLLPFSFIALYFNIAYLIFFIFGSERNKWNPGKIFLYPALRIAKCLNASFFINNKEVKINV